jgi:hypothetical protein
MMVPIVGVLVGCPTFVLCVALIFPSTRKAITDFVSRRGALSDESATAQLASANAQLSALRNEVYALRCEVAAVAQALPAANRQHDPALPR